MKAFFKQIIVWILTWEARLVLAKYRPKIIAITGSVGKTSTKDAVWSVLVPHFYARKSEKSFNSEIGVPLTILGLPNGWNNPFLWFRNIIRGFWLCLPSPSTLNPKPFPSWLVLEIGADRPGDIKRLGSWISPDVVIVTRFAEVPVHVQFFKSKEELIAEKSFLVKSLKTGGLLILNNDDEDVRALRDTRRDSQVITWSIDRESDFQASNFDFTYADKNGVRAPSGITFKVNYKGNSVPVSVFGALGRQQVHPVLSALALGDFFGLNMVKMMDSVANHKTPPGRMRLIEGVKHTTVIDDTYNSSPVAVAEALRTLAELKTETPAGSTPRGRKIAVLGDMLELGKYSIDEHKKAGAEAKKSCDILVTVGVRARNIAEGALNNGMDEKNIFQFDTSDESAKPVENLLSEGDIVLVKGSQGVRMEKIVEEIMAHPENKASLLVRQEPEWQNR